MNFATVSCRELVLLVVVCSIEVSESVGVQARRS